MEDARRESRIPRPAVAAQQNAKPLAEKTTNTLDRKRKADQTLEGIPEAKRAGGQAPPAYTRPTRSSNSAGTGQTGSTLRGSTLQHATSSRAAASVSEALAPVPEETWEDICDRTGQDQEEVLNKRLTFVKGTRPEKKLEVYGPHVKELRALGRHLLNSNQRLDMDVQQWKAHVAELQAAAEAERAAVAAKQEEVDKQLTEIKELLEMQEQQNTKLGEQLQEAEAELAKREAAVAETQAKLAGLQAELDKACQTIEERDAKIREIDELVRTSQKYSTTLQNYNTSLQSDLTQEKVKRDEVQRAKDELQGQVAELGGRVKSMEQLLAYEKDQVQKLRDEREAATRDLAVLRADLDNTRGERDRANAEAKRVQDELDRFKAAGGKSLETLELLTNDKATMEVQLQTQQRLITSMREELAGAKENRALADALAESRGMQMAELKAQIEQLQSSLGDAERRVYEGELMRRKLHNIIQELKGNIRVFCRVRPMSASEQSEAGEASEQAVDFATSGDLLGRGIMVTVPSNLSGKAPEKHTFGFDKVFGCTSTQDTVFEEISDLVQSALDGHKVCIFAYGQTGSGKTYTMLGSRDQPGMIPRAMRQIFESSLKLGQQGWQFNMQASMLEIYNEEYKDLLAKRKAAADARKHTVQHDLSAGVTTVTDMTVVDVCSPEAVESLLADAMEKRSVGCTAMNEQSSRSHMVFTLKIEGVNATTGVKVLGVLNLIDLAGSERVKESGATGVRLTEAQNINKSLSALGDVIMALANKEKHVPFRNSKLTYLLQPCLGGDAKTLMFVNVAPSREWAHESLCSLRFAAKVNACEINPRKNVAVPAK